MSKIVFHIRAICIILVTGCILSRIVIELIPVTTTMQLTVARGEVSPCVQWSVIRVALNRLRLVISVS